MDSINKSIAQAYLDMYETKQLDEINMKTKAGRKKAADEADAHYKAMVKKWGANHPATKDAEKAAKAMKQKAMEQKASWVPESIADEDVADFMGAAAAAAKAGKKEFKFGDKTYKVTMKKSTADKIDEAEVEMCEKCGKVHEGSCGSNENVKEEALDESPEQPRAKGEQDFKKMHDDNTEVKDEEDDDKENFKNIKKSADAIKK
jgi:hypothetical protein